MPSLHPTRPPCILIAEEEPGIVQVLRHVLQDEGFGVIATCDPAEAITMARQANVDLFIVDLGWGDETRLDLVGWLRAQGNEAAKAIGMSASARRVAEGCASGLFDEVIDKPFDWEDVVAIVHRLTGWPGND